VTQQSSVPWRQRSLKFRTSTTALFLGWLGFVAIVTPAAILLLVSSVTANARICAVVALLFSLAPGALFRRSSRKWAWAGLAAAVLLLLFVALRSPRIIDERGQFQSTCEHPAKPTVFSPARLVPELDQHLMGANLFAWLDPYIDRQQARELKQTLRAVYQPMREDPDFAECGNALHLCYRDMLLSSRPYHQFSYIHDTAAPDQPLPVLLFLHGSLGNFKGYLWQWKQLADEQQFAVVAPSFGLGEWNRRHVNQAAETALEWIENDPRLDASRITLAGLSNGAIGVTNAALHWEKRFERILYLSPVTVGERGDQANFAKTIGDTPILVISGRDDRRVPIGYLEELCNDLRIHHTKLTTVFLPDRDHFLFFSDFDAVRSAFIDQQTQPIPPHHEPEQSR